MDEPCNRKEDKERFKFKGFGVETEITGKELVKSVFALVIGGTLCGGLYVHDKNTMEAISKMTDTQVAMIYVIKLSQPERDALPLNKPLLIRQMEASGNR